jgi:hypothetical protein
VVDRVRAGGAATGPGKTSERLLQGQVSDPDPHPTTESGSAPTTRTCRRGQPKRPHARTDPSNSRCVPLWDARSGLKMCLWSPADAVALWFLQAVK